MNDFRQLLKSAGSHPPVGTWILSGHTQLPISDRGLRSGVVTLFGLDYAFGM